MGRGKGSHNDTPRARKNKTRLITPRSLAAQMRTKNPCAGCKRSRQKCTGGPPSVCSTCKAKGITCEPGKPETDSIQTEVHFVFENGQSESMESLHRNRQQRDTVCTDASSLVSPIVGENNTADNVHSPTSPVVTPSDVASENVCESPTTQVLVSGFNSFAIGDVPVVPNATVCSSTSGGEAGQPEEHILITGHFSFDTTLRNDTEKMPDVGSPTSGASYHFMTSSQPSSSLLGESSELSWERVTSSSNQHHIPIGLPSTSSSSPEEIPNHPLLSTSVEEMPIAPTTGMDFAGTAGGDEDIFATFRNGPSDDNFPFTASSGNTGVLTEDGYSRQYSNLDVDYDLLAWVSSLLGLS